MIPFAVDWAPAPETESCEEPHVLVVAGNTRTSYVLADQLLDAGYRVSMAPGFGLPDVLAQSAGEFDLLVATQNMGEMAQFGLPELVRSVQPDLPIVVVELETAGGPGTVDAVRSALTRWPVRERDAQPVH